MGVPIWVCGEVLVDLLPNPDLTNSDSASSNFNSRIAVVGGGPANTAKALARLGHDIEFIDGISTDAYGVRARSELTIDGVGLSLSQTSNKPTCKATVTLDTHGSATYEFLIDGTATFDFSSTWLPQGKPSVLYIGTLATVIEPGASVLFNWANNLSEQVPLVYDPNIRSAVISDVIQYLIAVEKWIGISTVVKVSEEDITWLYPKQDKRSVAMMWLTMGPKLIVITRSELGLLGISKDDCVSVPGVPVTIVDSVGAGDTVGAVIVEGVLKYGVAGMVGDNLKKVLQRAAKAASITVGRRGAQPPFRHEIGDL